MFEYILNLFSVKNDASKNKNNINYNGKLTEQEISEYLNYINNDNNTINDNTISDINNNINNTINDDNDISISLDDEINNLLHFSRPQFNNDVINPYNIRQQDIEREREIKYYYNKLKEPYSSDHIRYYDELHLLTNNKLRDQNLTSFSNTNHFIPPSLSYPISNSILIDDTYTYKDNVNYTEDVDFLDEDEYLYYDNNGKLTLGTTKNNTIKYGDVND